MTRKPTTIDHRDGIYFLEIPEREFPMGFFTCANAMSFSVNNLRREFKLTTAATVAWHREHAL